MKRSAKRKSTRYPPIGENMKYSGKRVLITGMRGFVGTHLSRRLKRKDAVVYGFVKEKESTDRIICGDMADFKSIKKAVMESEPDIIFHMAAQSFVPKSIKDPIETFEVNCKGTLNLLECVRNSDIDPIVILAGSSEEYGLVIKSLSHYSELVKNYRVIPEPTRIPELPINENNPLRPVNPYGISKTYDELIMRNYHQLYGVKTIVTRNFNHEGPGRGNEFVTSVIINQVKKLNKSNQLTIGNVNPLRDWSHIYDCIDGYLLMAERGVHGEVYNLGSMRTNSVLTFILLTLKESGYIAEDIKTIRNSRKIKDPLEIDTKPMFGAQFDKYKIDRMIAEEEVKFSLGDEGIIVTTNKGPVKILFESKYFRRLDIPILLCDIDKLINLGFEPKRSLSDIIRDQINA